MDKIELRKLGFSKSFSDEAAVYDDLYAGRIFSQYKDLYKVVCENGELTAEVSGKFRFKTKKQSDFPAVGDFVMLDRDIGANGNAIIHHVLSRQSAFIRKASGTSHDDQIVASNIDTVFICMALNNDYNLRRLERYLSIAWDSGAIPVIVLTKADLCEDIEERLHEVNTVAIGVDVLVTSAVEEDGYCKVTRYITEGQTVAFIGSSGVGKSTLINCLLGENKLATRGLRNDDKGQHTTTRRELITLPGGGMVIDTPGMRELGLESVNLAKAFSDIDELTAMCKFHDCTHTNEPDCAVLQAIRDGVILSERLLSYQKLKKEAKYEGLNSKQIENMKLNDMFSGLGGMKNARRFLKEKSKRS